MPQSAPSTATAPGDNSIRVVEGYDMLGPDDRIGLVGRSHPNDVGFVGMAHRLQPHLGAVWGL